MSFKLLWEQPEVPFKGNARGAGLILCPRPCCSVGPAPVRPAEPGRGEWEMSPR